MGIDNKDDNLTSIMDFFIRIGDVCKSIKDGEDIEKLIEENPDSEKLFEIYKRCEQKYIEAKKLLFVLKGRYLEGCRYIVRDEQSETVEFYSNMPYKNEFFNYYLPDDKGELMSMSYSNIYDFVTWENSPINIEEMLKANGVDIDEI